MSTKLQLIIFDVNETLLDMAPLRNKVNQALGSESAFDLWFNKLLHYSLIESITENYTDFSSIAAAVFEMVAEGSKKRVSEAKKNSVLSTITKLPAHLDVRPALEQLEKHQIPLVALTNGNQEVVEKQLAHANIAHFFDHIFSVEKQGQRYKPHRRPYDSVLEIMQVKAEDSLMIAAHAWDIMGAQRAGMRTAFVEREGKSMYPLAPTPDFTAKTVLGVVEKIGIIRKQ